MNLLKLLQKVPVVSVAGLRAELEHTTGDEVLILDVREPGEYARGHLPGARHIPLSQLADRAGELDPAARIVTL